MLLQACQVSNNGSSRISTGIDRHLQLTRPNTVLLSATMTGGKAERGVFTGAMAEQVRKTKCKTDIYQLFTSAREHMKNNGSGYQVPEFRSTLLEPLCLPVAPKVSPEEIMFQPQLISDHDIRKFPSCSPA